MNDIKKDVDMYIPIKQIAKEWNVNRMFIIQEIKLGNIEAVILGRGYKIRKSVLDAYIENHTVRPVNKK